MGGSVDAAAAARTLEGAYAVIRSLITTPASATELQMIKGTSFEPASQTSDAMITAWLDIDTYGLVSISEQRRIRDTISAADLQRVAERLFRENSIASVIVGNEEALKAEFAADKIQLVGSAVPGNRAQDQFPPGNADPSSKTATPTGVVPAVSVGPEARSLGPPEDGQQHRCPATSSGSGDCAQPDRRTQIRPWSDASPSVSLAGHAVPVPPR
jgi:hypothetical protein